MDDVNNVSENNSNDNADAYKSEKARKQPRSHGKFVKVPSVDELKDKINQPGSKVSVSENKKKPTISGDDPPLVDVKVTNPISYLKKWWKKIIGNEGIQLKFSLKVKPLTAFFLIILLVSGGVTIGLINKIKDKTPVAQYIPAFGAEEPVSRAFSGRLESDSKGNYFLITASEVITVKAKSSNSLQTFIGKSVLVSGAFTDVDKTLQVSEIKELEVSSSK